MRWLVGFARFWYDFIVGDDWTIAVAVVVVLVIADVVANAGRAAWPIVPLGVAAVLSLSVWRVLRSEQQRAHDLSEGPNP